MTYDDNAAAAALVRVVGDRRWQAVALAQGFLELQRTGDKESAARGIYDAGGATLTKARAMVSQMGGGFLQFLEPRTRTGSAENAITKLFPATITEERFQEALDELRTRRTPLDYTDQREAGHGLADFTMLEETIALPVNIKNAGTRFERSEDLVGLAPDDCIPIPAYKANAAVEQYPSLLYVVCPDYELLGRLHRSLPEILTPQEAIVWDLLKRYSGARVRDAEDGFIFGTVRRHWAEFKALADARSFHVISARKALRILHTNPKRTPGIGLRAWGTGASAEVNVHISIGQEMTPWETVASRIVNRGLADIVAAVNRRRVEEVHDPEI